jgi:hypothetical protein
MKELFIFTRLKLVILLEVLRVEQESGFVTSNAKILPMSVSTMIKAFFTDLKQAQ